MAESAQDHYLYSPAYKVTSDVAVSVGGPMTYDGFYRLIYNRISANIQLQSDAFLRRGNLTAQEAAHFVNARNELLVKIRSRMTPFGEAYSEIIKPRTNLPSFEKLLKSKGSIEVVLSSVGKNRQVVDRIGVAMRVAGPVTIIVSVTCSAVVIAQASPAERGRVAAREIGATTGSIAGGIAGMWAGCEIGATIASPSLIVPFWGEVSTGGACFVGGLLGGFGVGFVGHKVGSEIGLAIYNRVSDFRWER